MWAWCDGAGIDAVDGLGLQPFFYMEWHGVWSLIGASINLMGSLVELGH